MRVRSDNCQKWRARATLQRCLKDDRNKTIKLLKIIPIIIETFQKLYSKANLEALTESRAADQKDGNLLEKLVDPENCGLLQQLLQMRKVAQVFSTEAPRRHGE